MDDDLLRLRAYLLHVDREFEQEVRKGRQAIVTSEMDARLVKGLAPEPTLRMKRALVRQGRASWLFSDADLALYGLLRGGDEG